MMKQIYSCEICGHQKPVAELQGIIFSNNKYFKIGNPRDTDGVHICSNCMTQLKEQLCKSH